jgi:biotin carboxylase
MRQRLAEAGVESTASATVRDVAELRDFAAAHGYPCVVKPASGLASAGVSVISGPDEAEAAFARAQAITVEQGTAPALATIPLLAANSAASSAASSAQAASSAASSAEAVGDSAEAVSPIQVLAEKFMSGPQYSVECFSEQGEHQVVTITRKYSDPVSLVELGHVMPAPLEPADQEAVGAYVVRVLDALGVEFGPTHTEIVLTESGPRIIETHLRFGGDHIWDLVTDATGVDLVKNQWRQMIGEKVLPGIRATLQDPDRTPSCQAIWFASTSSTGVLVEITGIEGPHPDGVTVKYPLPPGTELNGLQSSFSRLAQARAHADTPDAALALARQAIEGLEIVVRVPSTVPEVM